MSGNTGSVITVCPEDVVQIATFSDVKTYHLGQELTNANCQTHFRARYFHGSSSLFDKFEGSNHFFTEEVIGALGFAGLSDFFGGVHTPDQALRLYCCRLKIGDVFVADKQNCPEVFEDSLFAVTNKPDDKKCQAFLAKHKEFDAIQFSGADFSDAGVTKVWFLSDPSLIEIVSVHRCFEVVLEEMANTIPKKLQSYVTSGHLTCWSIIE